VPVSGKTGNSVAFGTDGDWWLQHNAMHWVQHGAVTPLSSWAASTEQWAQTRVQTANYECET